MTIVATVHWDRTDIMGAMRAFQRLKDSADKGSDAFVNDVARNVYRLSQVIVPVRTGRLRASGRVSESQTSGPLHTASVEYGGLGTTLNRSGQDYAIYAHEIPPTHGGKGNTGNKHKPPTSYKYLERPAAEEFARADPKLYRHLVARFEKDWYN